MPTSLEIAFYEAGVRFTQARMVISQAQTRSTILAWLDRLERAIRKLAINLVDLQALGRTNQLLDRCYELTWDLPEECNTPRSHCDECVPLLDNVQKLLIDVAQDESRVCHKLSTWVALGFEIPLGTSDYDPPWEWLDDAKVRQLIADAGTAIDVVFPERADDPIVRTDSKNFQEGFSQWLRIDWGLALLKSQVEPIGPSPPMMQLESAPQKHGTPPSIQTILARAGKLTPKQREIVTALHSAGQRRTKKQILDIMNEMSGEASSEGTVGNYLLDLVNREILDNRQDVDPHGYWFSEKMLN